MFLLEFEKKLVEYFYNSPLRVKQVFFGNGKYQFIDAFSKVKTMPYVHISRTVDSGSLGKTVVVYDKNEKHTFFPIKIDYTMYCVVEKNSEMLSFLSDMRFYTKNNPNVFVWYPRIEPRRIQLGDIVYHGNGYNAEHPADPEFIDRYCSTVDHELYYMVGAKKEKFFKLSDGKFISYGGTKKLSDDITILDARDYIKIPEPVRVELSYSSLTTEEYNNAVNEKGAIRCFQLKFHTEMFTESISTLPYFKSIKVIVRANPNGGEFVAFEESDESDE